MTTTVSNNEYLMSSVYYLRTNVYENIRHSQHALISCTKVSVSSTNTSTPKSALSWSSRTKFPVKRRKLNLKTLCWQAPIAGEHKTAFSPQATSLINRGKTPAGSCVIAEHSVQRRLKAPPSNNEPASKHCWMAVVPGMVGSRFTVRLSELFSSLSCMVLSCRWMTLQTFEWLFLEEFLSHMTGRLTFRDSTSPSRLTNLFASRLLTATYRGLKPPTSLSRANSLLSLSRTQIGPLMKRLNDFGGSLYTPFSQFPLGMTLGRLLGKTFLRVEGFQIPDPKLGDTSIKRRVVTGSKTNSYSVNKTKTVKIIISCKFSENFCSVSLASIIVGANVLYAKQ